jgi:two-component system, NtrC family, sensor kinase
MNTIKSRITVFVILCLIFFSVLTFLYYDNIFLLENKVLITEKFHELLDNILELRRYEKNYVYYHDGEDRYEIVSYLYKTEDALKRSADEIRPAIGENELRRFTDNLTDYKAALQKTMVLMGNSNAEPIYPEVLRSRGKVLVDSAQGLINLNSSRIREAMRKTFTIPLAFMAIFMLLAVFIFVLVVRSVLKPLAMIRKATEEVARETFAPISIQTGRKDEVSQLIVAFNKMAEELESRQTQLLQSRKMASIGTLTSGIAHELNNPLNNISLTAETLLMNHREMSDAEKEEMLQEIMHQSDRGSQVVKNLLEFSRTDRPFLSALSVEETLKGTIRLIRNQLMVNRIKLHQQIQADIPFIRGKRQDLEQAFLNILLNSIQAMPEGGEITIRAGLGPDGYIRVDLEDTGTGIKPEDLTHIFDPFYTTKPVGQGTGLGLSLTYGIVRNHGGYIETKSQLNKGTTFSIYLPTPKESNEKAYAL